MEGCNKGIVKGGPTCGCGRSPGKGEVCVDYSHGEGLCEESRTCIIHDEENRIRKRRYEEHRGFLGQQNCSV